MQMGMLRDQMKKGLVINDILSSILLEMKIIHYLMG